jgi:heme-degrading monooxygenase HmoA
MLVKLIFCEVPHEQKDSFSEKQKEWKKLKEVKGFIRQEGGWVVSGDQNIAVIIAFWQSNECYEDFMEHSHDEIINDAHQADTYTSITIKIFNAQHVPEIMDVHRDIKTLQLNKDVTQDQILLESETVIINGNHPFEKRSSLLHVEGQWSVSALK